VEDTDGSSYESVDEDTESLAQGEESKDTSQDDEEDDATSTSGETTTSDSTSDETTESDHESAVHVEGRRKAVMLRSRTGKHMTKEELTCLIASAEEKRALAAAELQEKQGEVEKLQLIFDIRARMKHADASHEHVHEWTQNGNMQNIMLRCVANDMTISADGFEVLMQEITPSIMDPAFVAQSNKYVPRQITRLCNDIKYCVDQDCVHVSIMGEDNGTSKYYGLLVRAQQAYKLTAGMEGTKYGEWRGDYKNGMDLLAKLINEPYPARSGLRKVIDRNGLRHMSDGPYIRHEPIVSEARF
jgi:hypothetical protein